MSNRKQKLGRSESLPDAKKTTMSEAMRSTPGTIYAEKRWKEALGGIDVTTMQRAIIEQELKWAFDHGCDYGKRNNEADQNLEVHIVVSCAGGPHVYYELNHAKAVWPSEFVHSRIVIGQKQEDY